MAVSMISRLCEFIAIQQAFITKTFNNNSSIDFFCRFGVEKKNKTE
jgi:hypothetical protein